MSCCYGSNKNLFLRFLANLNNEISNPRYRMYMRRASNKTEPAENYQNSYYLKLDLVSEKQFGIERSVAKTPRFMLRFDR